MNKNNRTIRLFLLFDECFEISLCSRWIFYSISLSAYRHHYEKLPWTLVPMHPVQDDPIAAPIDPGIPQRSFTEKDFEGEFDGDSIVHGRSRQIVIWFVILIKQKYQFTSLDWDVHWEKKYFSAVYNQFSCFIDPFHYHSDCLLYLSTAFERSKCFFFYVYSILHSVWFDKTPAQLEFSLRNKMLPKWYWLSDLNLERAFW